MTTKTLPTLAALLALIILGASAAPASAQDFRPITVDGNTTASGQAVSVVYDAGTFHLWYRDTAGTIGGLNYATSSDGVNFASQGSLSFSSDPFPTGTAPFLYYENVSKIAGDYKIQHWTYNGGDGSYPNYNYNISISDAGSGPGLVVDHQGPVGGGTFGQTAGSFGIVGGYLYMQGGAGRQLVRASYVDGNPPNVSGSLLPAVGDFQSLFDSLGISNGYINNHSDVVDVGDGSLAFLFTVRDSSGNRLDQQLYASQSFDGGATWSAAFPTLSSPTLNGGAFGGNFAHADVVMAGGNPIAYFSSQDANGDYIIATNAVPEPATLAILGLATCGLTVLRRRKK